VLADERFTPPIVDMDLTREVRGMCDAAFAKMTLEEAGEKLSSLDLAWAPLATLAEMADAPWAERAGCFITVEDGWGGTFRAPAAPARFPEGQPPVGRAAPKLGQHTREVLEAAGLSPAEIAEVMGEPVGAAV
jgi:crotonobetainyl-CoA:carnitine CoA-transferase CaiB-like acyl-CoA transferase